MKKSRYGAAFIILAALLFLFLVLNICIGSVNIPVSEIPKMLWGNGADETFTDIVMGIRFPRAMAGNPGRRAGIVRISFADFFS